MKRRTRTPPRGLVEWRGGVHLVGTPLHCDAPRGREACFVSCAAAAGAARHRQIIATEATIRLLGALPRRTTLAVPYGRPFSLGTLRLELFPSGHAVGAASLAVDLAGARVVYAGVVAPRGGGLAGAAEVRPCDVLVVDASGADPRRPAPAPTEVQRALRAWVADAVAAGATPVLLAAPLGRAADLIALLGADFRLRAHRSIVDAARRLRALGHPLPKVGAFAGTPAAGDVVLWPVAAAAARAVSALRRPRRALVDAAALDPAAAARLGADPFPFTDRADAADLATYITASGASEVHLLGASDALLAAFPAARPLGPPRQLALFRGHDPGS